MKTSVCLAVLIAALVIQVVNAQETTVVTTRCPVYKCAEGCVHGTGPNGCPTCFCPPTCKDINCTEDEECILRQIFFCSLKGVPCFPRPTCVPRNDTTVPPPVAHACPTIECVDECLSEVMSDGCPTCRPNCGLTCQNVECPIDTDCVMEPMKGCSRVPCNPRPVCILRTDATTPTILDSTAKKCKQTISCREGCRMLKDSDDCPYCDCPLTCETVGCRDGYACEMRSFPCPEFLSSCPKRPLCVPIIEMTTPCPMMSCDFDCLLFRESHGCSYCMDVNCTKDEECYMKQNDCPTPACGDIPTCVPRPITCPTKPPCQLLCSTAFKKDENGCIICECKE